MDLAKSAMLVSVTIVNGGLLGERRDKTATGYVERKFKLNTNRAKASKFLIDRKQPKVKAVVAASQRVREVLYKYTMPWGDDKSRLLPTDLEEMFRTKMIDAEAELRAAWEEYLQVYPGLVADSERELGDLFDRQEYPSIKRAREMFSYKLTYWPIPQTSNFVANIAEDAVKRATDTMRLEIETRLKGAAHDAVQRARGMVENFVERLEAFKTKADGKIIRDSLLINLSEISTILFAMNVTNNKEINEMANQIARLSWITADQLRNSEIDRKDYIRMGKKILAKTIELDHLDLQVADMVADAGEYADF